MGCCNPSKESEGGGSKDRGKNGKSKGIAGQAVEDYQSEGFASDKTSKTVASFGVSSKSMIGLTGRGICPEHDGHISHSQRHR